MSDARKEDNTSDPSGGRTQQYLANQRTFLSWLRTSIGLIGLGFAIERFSIFLQQFRLLIQSQVGDTGGNNDTGALLTSHEYSAIIGLGMVLLGVVLIGYALKSYLDGNRNIASNTFLPSNSIVYAATLTITGLGIATIVFLILQLIL